MTADLTGELVLSLNGAAENVGQVAERLGGPRDVSELARALLASGIALNASDAHLEPEEERVLVRLRIDGVLRDAAQLAPENYARLLSRIKLLAGIKLNVTDRPQDGRFTVVADEQDMEVRVSTLPSEHGETAVLRILDPKHLMELSELGLREDLLSLFGRKVREPNGMLVVTGPTGSGKTTTLYAFLQEVRSPEIKVITIEDPIEYHLQGISQTQVDEAKGYGFANGLKAIVRQDPDVILVGEMRDLDTSSIALQAALTGHLVFSTLHTNDAAGTVTRLLSLGAKEANIAPALNLAVAQRLVRRVCASCAKQRPLTKEEKGEVELIPSKLRPKGTSVLGEAGCEDCGGTGYKGRIGLFEAIDVTPEVRELILSSPSAADLQKHVEMSMRQDGIIKVLEGITTFEEVDRVT